MTTSGYNCYRCGAWIMEAQTHSCVVYTSPASPPAPVWTREDVDTIIRLLKSIEYQTKPKR